MSIWLLDTGPIVAYLDPAESAHLSCAAVIDNFRGEFATTNAVLTEAMFFASAMPSGPEKLAELVSDSGMKVLDCCQVEGLRGTAHLMRKYADTPMDFADASLVYLSDIVRQYSICTLDRRGFSIFRSMSGKRFRLVLDASS